MQIDCPNCQGQGGFTTMDTDVWLEITRRCDNCPGTGKVEAADPQEPEDRPMTGLEYDIRYGGNCIHP